MTKHIYFFGLGEADGDETMATLLGGKGAGLAEMTRLGLPVPPGFTLTTEVCREFLQRGFTEEILAAIHSEVGQLELLTGRRLGSRDKPLILAVRSGAQFSMPGMMDTVHYVGLNESTALGLPQTLAKDCIKRLQKKNGNLFPTDPLEQLIFAIRHVFSSWNGPTAREYRKQQAIPENLGTACNVQLMVFGNMDAKSGSGVAFTRDPLTGNPALTGEFLPSAPGEDLVSGAVTPQPLERMNELLPDAFRELIAAMAKLETHYRDVLEIEFTVESGYLWLLQVVKAKQSATAKIRTVVSMAQAGLITEDEAIMRVIVDDLARLSLKQVAEGAVKPAAKGISGSPGAVCGQVVFSADEVSDFENPILVRQNPDRDDIKVIGQLAGLVAIKGGVGSHFSVVARNRGIPAVVGCEEQLKLTSTEARFGDHLVKSGDWITLDGSTGNVFLGHLPLSELDTGASLKTFLSWCDQKRSLGIRAFADSPEQAIRARELDVPIAISTERMFMDEDVSLIEEAILADSDETKSRVHERILRKQQEDFEEIFRLTANSSVVIRLLDPPLSEFLPSAPTRFHQNNPLFGHRGCRLFVTHPELYRLQIQATFQAMKKLEGEGCRVQPIILVPLVTATEELTQIRTLANELFTATFGDGPEPDNNARGYGLGSMVETPRAALLCDKISQHADYLAFGLMDLSQCVFGASRDDTSAFLPAYLEKGMWAFDPFTRIDQDGVGKLINLACQDARKANPNIKIEITAWDPDSIQFVQRVLKGHGGLICPLPLLTQVKLAAAQAALTNQ